MVQERKTQAVVIIHGIGEQKPMATVRAFVDAVLPDHLPGPKYFSKPDPLSALYELRTLQNRSQPRTQFFEYYWAHKINGTQFQHIWDWLFKLLWRTPASVPRQLHPLWTLAWIVVLTIAGWALFGLGEAFVIGTNGIAPFFAPIAAVLLYLLHRLALSHVGDAARYLSAAPPHVTLRHQIRADGIGLLRRLHESNRYDRIVVVGHSLGSVIAYDILRHYWAMCHRTYMEPRKDPQHALHNLEVKADALYRDPNAQNLERFQEAQLEAWRENRSLGNPWRVTDLITLGSPLSHAALLMADSPETLLQRQSEREFPRCPPVEESPRTKDGTPGELSFRVWSKFHDEDGHAHTLHALHYGAVFGVTRWTNLFFPTRFGFFGDPLSGALAQWFGPGIRDVPVSTKRGILSRYSPLSNSAYWWTDPKARPDHAQVSKDSRDAVEALIYALDLERTRTVLD